MANINQPPAGIPDDPHSGEVTLTAVSYSEATGESIRTELYSDGSRKHYKNNELIDEQRVFTDQEKAEGAMRPDFHAEPVAGAAADEPPLDDDIQSDLPPEAVADIVTSHGVGASGVLNDSPGAGQPVGEDNKVESDKTDEVLFMHTPPEASQSQLPADAKLMEDGDPTEAEEQQAVLDREDDGPAPEEHNEARDKAEEASDKAAAKAKPRPPKKKA